LSDFGPHAREIRQPIILDLDCENGHMRISAKADYAVRAALELAAVPDGEPVKGERLADAQGIPLQFLEHILLELKHARLVRARRGARGGYWLARPPEEITLADVIRAVEGPLANIQDAAPEATHYPGHAERLRDVWVAVRANLRAVLENVTLADLTAGKLPDEIAKLISDPDAWEVR
jgi:Rrf2 family protein